MLTIPTQPKAVGRKPKQLQAPLEPITPENPEPWLKAGISRRTYYRRLQCQIAPVSQTPPRARSAECRNSTPAQPDPKPKPKIGRPPFLTKELQAEVCKLIVANHTVRQICSLPHMPNQDTIYSTLNRDAEFAEQFARARELQLQRWEDELNEIADDSSNDWIHREVKSGRIAKLPDPEVIQRSKLRVETRKWLMSKRMPRKYGERLESVHSGTVTLQALVEAIGSDKARKEADAILASEAKHGPMLIEGEVNKLD